MTLNYTVRGQVKITMIDYVEEILTAFSTRQIPREVALRQALHPRIFSESTKIVRSSSQMKLV
jgi:hypothetical protein